MPQGVQREDVGRSLPDRQHLRVAQQHGNSSVLDVTRAAEGFERFAHDVHGLLAGCELHDRSEEPKENSLRVKQAYESELPRS